jgi:hypothetical protein
MYIFLVHLQWKFTVPEAIHDCKFKIPHPVDEVLEYVLPLWLALAPQVHAFVEGLSSI